MGQTLFISDLHLDRERPEIIKLFVDFLKNEATEAEALYILGDLFEYWVGDDQPLPGLENCLAALQSLTENNIPVYFIHGNRDFLIGKRFADKTGITLLPESKVIDLYGTPTLILHGDTLCTDDVDYQKMRQMLRDLKWQEQFLSLPIETRIKEALKLREKSQQATEAKEEMIMDVNQTTVVSIMQENDVLQMIHGHTHRPAVHDLEIDGEEAKRIVLGDWYHQGSVLYCSENEMKLKESLINS